MNRIQSFLSFLGEKILSIFACSFPLLLIFACLYFVFIELFLPTTLLPPFDLDDVPTYPNSEYMKEGDYYDAAKEQVESNTAHLEQLQRKPHFRSGFIVFAVDKEITWRNVMEFYAEFLKKNAFSTPRNPAPLPLLPLIDMNGHSGSQEFTRWGFGKVPETHLHIMLVEKPDMERNILVFGYETYTHVDY
jgi:hypothetical protein